MDCIFQRVTDLTEIRLRAAFASFRLIGYAEYASTRFEPLEAFSEAILPFLRRLEV